MNLSDELQDLARSAPPVADPDVIVRLARVRRGRRMAGGSALLVLVVALPLWLWVGGRDDEAASTRLTLTFTVDGPQGSAERARGILQERANAIGFGAPQAIVVDDRTITLEAGVPNGLPADWLATPGRLQIRKVLKASPNLQQPPAPPPGGTPARTPEELKTKLGDAYDAAVMLTAPAEAADRFAAFAALIPAEVAMLPPAVQFNVPTVTCGQLDSRPSELPAEREVVSCDGGIQKLLLAPARVVGADIAEVTSADGQVISLRMTAAGGPKWAELTREAFRNTDSECDPSAVGDQGRCLLAFVIDGRSVSAPQILAESVAADIIPHGSKEEVQRIAATIGPRELPSGVTLTPRA